MKAGKGVLDAHVPKRRAAVRISPIWLPEQTRTVIDLRRIDGLPQREAADACGLTESSIVKHLRRGLRLVRAEINPTDEGPFE